MSEHSMRPSATGNFLHGTIWLPASIWCIDKGRFPVERGIKWKYEKILDIGTFRNLWMIIYVSTLKNYASFRKKASLTFTNFILEKLSVRCVNENFRYFPFSHLTGPPPPWQIWTDGAAGKWCSQDGGWLMELQVNGAARATADWWSCR